MFTFGSVFQKLSAAGTGFHTPVFLLAFFTFLVLFTWTPARRRRVLVLLVSIAFYLLAGPGAVLILLVSSLLNFMFVRLIHRIESPFGRKVTLAVTVATTLSFLAWWKYLSFALGTVGLTPESALGRLWVWPLNLAPPLGISFFCFLQISYGVDVYGRKLSPLSVCRYAHFILFFPKMVSGPLVRPAEFADKYSSIGAIDNSLVRQGLQRLAVGLIKKIVFADALAVLVNSAFGSDFQGMSCWRSLFSLYAYAFQIYLDFSGYTDMAIGISMMLGYRLPENFDRPYAAESVRDFWRRWHITLGAWLRDYVYIPLGGSRVAKPLVIFNLMATFLLCGLWHGASWNFVIWGGLHGIYLVAGRLISTARFFKNRTALVWVNRFLTFNAVVFAWLFFRAADLQTVGHFFGTFRAVSLEGSELMWLLYAVALVVAHGIMSRLKRCFLGVEVHPTISMACIAAVGFMAAGTVFELTPFIYANF